MPFEELKARLSEVWGSAPWERIAPMLAPMHDHMVTALSPQPGERWLDVATGTGAVALRAARAGTDVTGVDLAPALVETARALAREEGVSVRYDVGDAEDLPYDDGSFDVVSSAVGAVLAPDHAAVARELARVCRPGGRLGLTAWRPGVSVFAITRRFQPSPEPGAGDREDWGREEYVRELLGGAFELRFEEGDSPFVGRSGEEAWETIAGASGPFKALTESLEPDRRRELSSAVIDEFESHRGDGGVVAPAPYLLVLGRRR
jgi:SAM-dependent methyltransferase